MKKIICLTAFAVISASVFCEALFTGDGRKDLSVQVESPELHNIGDDSAWIPDFVVNTISDDIGKYSNITVVDVQNAKKVAETQKRDEKGLADDSDLVEAGAFMVARNVLLVSITQKPTSFALSVRINDKEKNTSLASYSEPNCSYDNLKSGLVLKEAVADLLEQLNVSLTAEGKQKLLVVKSSENEKSIEAQKLIAQGNLVLQRGGSKAEALSYFIQANSNDASLRRAIESMSQTSIAIASGDIGTQARNAIQQRKDFLKLINEIRENNKKNPPFYVVFDPNLELKEINYKNKTVDVELKVAVVRDLEKLRLCNNVVQAYKKANDSENWGKDFKNALEDIYAHDRFTMQVLLSDKAGKVLGEKIIKGDIITADFCSWDYDEDVNISISADTDTKNIVMTIPKILNSKDEAVELSRLTVDDYLNKVLIQSFKKEEIYPSIYAVTLPLPDGRQFFSKFCNADLGTLAQKAIPDPMIECVPGGNGWSLKDLSWKLHVPEYSWYILNGVLNNGAMLESGNWSIANLIILDEEKRNRGWW